MYFIAAAIILILLSTPLLTLLLVTVIVALRLFSLWCCALVNALDAVIPEEQRRWAEEGPDDEEMKLIEREIENGNISLT